MMTEARKKRPAPAKGRGVIIVHGHRHSCLFRQARERQNHCETLNIIVPKILKSSAFTYYASGGSISGTKKGAPM